MYRIHVTARKGSCYNLTGPGTYIGRATFLMFAGEVPRAFSRRGRAAHHQSYVHNVDRVKVLIKKSSTHGKPDIAFGNAGINPSRATILDMAEEN